MKESDRIPTGRVIRFTHMYMCVNYKVSQGYKSHLIYLLWTSKLNFLPKRNRLGVNEVRDTDRKM